MRQSTLLMLFILLIAVIVSCAVLSGFLVDWLWFDALGFGAVFITVWKAKLAAFGIAGIAVMHAIRKGQLLFPEHAPQTPAEQFSALAA
jgi:uncharacterized membrane protein (UPF0182 family)